MMRSAEERELFLRNMLWAIGAAHPDDPKPEPLDSQSCAELLGFSSHQLVGVADLKLRTRTVAEADKVLGVSPEVGK